MVQAVLILLGVFAVIAGASSDEKALDSVRRELKSKKSKPTQRPTRAPSKAVKAKPTRAPTKKDIDKHGCCISCGEFYCLSQNKCVTDWADCVEGTFDTEACTYTHTASVDGSTFHYDLSPYQTDSFYKISDMDSHPNMEYYYFFRLCAPLNTSIMPEVCAETSGSGDEACDNDAMAFQYFTTNWNYESCYRLSGCFDDAPQREMGLLDPVEPASGIYLKYSGGNTCQNSYADKASCDTHVDDDSTSYCARSFKLNIKCHNEIDEIPEDEEVEENAGCQYEATINHVMGCPVECPRDSDGRVCSARGSCFYGDYDGGLDVDQKTTPLQCLCMQGYYGDACEMTQFVATLTYVSDQSGVSMGFLWFIIFLLLILIGVLILLNWATLAKVTKGIMSTMLFYWDKYSGEDARGKYAPVPTHSEMSRLSGSEGESVKSTFERMAQVPSSSFSLNGSSSSSRKSRNADSLTFTARDSDDVQSV